MTIVVNGVKQRTSPLDVLERLTVKADAVAKAATSICRRSNVNEAVVLSTCNRTEIYVVAERFHGGLADVVEFLSETSGLGIDDLDRYLYSHHDDAAVNHLFEVVCGLDSAVLGEHEILGQVRGAWEIAMAEGAARSTLNLLFRHALETGKRARTETGIARSTASVSHAAVELAKADLDGLADRRILVVGAGQMGEGMAVALGAQGVREIAVTNRTTSRAQELAARVGGRVAPFIDLPAAIAEADLVLTSTGAGSAIIDRDMVALAMSVRPNRPLLVVDIALPRDVEASVGELANVALRNLDDLQRFAALGIERRAGEVTNVREIIAQEAERHAMESLARQAAPLVAQLHGRLEEIRAAEIERHGRRLGDLTAEQREAVEALTRSLLAKVLHGATIKLKNDAGSPRGERNAAAVRDLFDLS